MKPKRGRVFVLSAPSGSGKTTICKRLLEECPNLVLSVSMTTRIRRSGERDKKDYIFVSKKEFEKFRRQGKLLERAEVFGNFYGTPREFVENSISRGRDVLLIIDVQGAFKVKKKMPEAILIFLLPPSFEELESRLRKRRTDNQRQINLRLKIARREIALAEKYDHRVVNDTIEEAARQLQKIIEK